MDVMVPQEHDHDGRQANAQRDPEPKRAIGQHGQRHRGGLVRGQLQRGAPPEHGLAIAQRMAQPELRRPEQEPEDREPPVLLRQVTCEPKYFSAS